MAQEERVPYEVAVKRLHHFQHLSQVIDDNWLKKQLGKSVEQYSLIAGWLTTSDIDWNWAYRNLATALDDAVAILTGNVSQTVWNKLQKKITAHSSRAQSKGTLAEISLAVFLVQHHIPFEMETKLDSALKKDVDFTLQFDGLEPVHIEMQWVSESETSIRAAKAGAPYGLGANFDYSEERMRILNKIYDKTPKFTQGAITLVALHLADPMISGTFPWGPVGEDLEHALGNETYGPLSENAATIRELVDGVIWFGCDLDNAFFPVQRGCLLNQHSPHFHKPSLSKWVEIWSGTNGEDS